MVDEITAAHGPDAASFLALDLSDLAAVRAGAERYIATGEPIDVLIDNAGLAGQRGSRPTDSSWPSGSTTWATSSSPRSCSTP